MEVKLMETALNSNLEEADVARSEICNFQLRLRVRDRPRVLNREDEGCCVLVKITKAFNVSSKEREASTKLIRENDKIVT